MDTSLLELSKHLVSESDLRDVAITGLGIKRYIVGKHITDNPKDITSAAYKCFVEWLNTQPNLSKARENMNIALDEADKTLLKQNFNQACG